MMLQCILRVWVFCFVFGGIGFSFCGEQVGVDKLVWRVKDGNAHDPFVEGFAVIMAFAGLATLALGAGVEGVHGWPQSINWSSSLAAVLSM